VVLLADTAAGAVWAPRRDGVLSRDELDDALASGTVVLPGPTSIARMLIEDWYGGPIR